MNIHDQQRPSRLPELIWRQVDDGMVIVSPTAGQVRVLNQLGTTIWEQLDGQHTIRDIEGELLSRYPHIPTTQIQTDLHQFLNDLNSRGLIRF